ncbi:DUF4349 domain-containing protein [Patulibacter sp.]|uniref:DUF4349 domain-containing protein n=1 Tax=Patulibacter sp. TaxID=1912859 RepID=UPI002723C2E8|nr:DUF4349 domain-containing protein [Patulibacter sp.]MDO9408174.1 DUF4349 domain-containing protein [Patulibacter sp.]
MLRSDPRLTPETLEDLDRLDAALAAILGAPAPSPGRATPERDGDAAPSSPGGAPADDGDRELLDLVTAVRATRPELDAGTRVRLDDRVRAAKQADADGRRSGARGPLRGLVPAERRWRTGLALAAVVAVAVPVGVVARDGLMSGESSGPSGVVAQPTSGAVAESSERDTTADGGLRSGSAALPAAPSAGSVGRGSRTGSTGTTSAARPPVPTVGQAPLDAPRRVVRDVEQTVRIAAGKVAGASARVTTIVQDAGGYLASSEVRERGSAAGGTFQVVVPSARLDATVAALSRIGRPVRLERSSTDVTDQATSLDDALRDLRADRASARLALARTVDPDRRAARRRELTLLSSRVAALQGERDALRRRTATSRIDLRLTTSTTGAEDDAAPAADDGSWGLGDAWRDAGRVLEVGGGVLLVGGAIVLPLVGLLALGLVLRRRTVGRRRDDLIDRA